MAAWLLVLVGYWVWDGWWCAFRRGARRVATNAKLSKVGATRLAKMAQAGVLRALSPGHTMSDGDIVIALSLGVSAADVVGQAIVRGVTTAKGMGGVPGLG